MKPLVTGPIDDTHSTTTDFSLDRVRVPERLVQTLGQRALVLVARFGHSGVAHWREKVSPQELTNLAQERPEGNRPRQAGHTPPLESVILA
jgi:hypothetical protein